MWLMKRLTFIFPGSLKVMDIKVSNFGDLMQGYSYAEIINLLHGNVVRKLSVVGNQVQVDALEPPILILPLNTPIIYEPWFMDRGSLLFNSPELPGRGKICTELDIIRFPDGIEATIHPGNISCT